VVLIALDTLQPPSITLCCSEMLQAENTVWNAHLNLQFNRSDAAHSIIIT